LVETNKLEEEEWGKDIEALADLRCVHGLRTICNLLVHSFVFMPASDESGTEWIGFYLNSDRTRRKELLFIAKEDFDVLVDEVIKDGVATLHFDRIRDRVTKSRVGEGDVVPRISLNAAVKD
jgi:hypothetical protein